MIKVGLTGNIGSGKTTVCRIFESMGIPVFYADTEAKKLYARDSVKAKLSDAFGQKVFDEQGTVDFKKLAGIIFTDGKALEWINRLIHPLVFEVYNDWLAQHHSAPYSIHESAILFENNFQGHFDKTLVVSAPESVRLHRIIMRDNLSEENVKNRMSNQLPDDIKDRLADYVIKNDGSRFLIPQIIKIHQELLSI